MLDAQTIKDILARGKPEPEDVPWWGEPNLGGWYTDAEIEAAVKAIKESSDWTKGFWPNSPVIEEFENAFARYCGTQYAISTNSGGTGIDMAMHCLDLEPGDEVICPAINYKSAHLAILGQGGKVVFCEARPETLNLDPADVEKRITPHTRAIFPVYMNGLSAPMDELLEIAERHPHPRYGPLKVIGDAARACGAGYKGEKVGSKGWMNIFSFHTQKHMTTLGEGGMITTDDAKLAHRLRNIKQFGGEEEWGSNYKMNKVQAAVGLVQLSRLDEMNRRRREAAHRRTGFLNGTTELVLPTEPPGYEHIYYVYALLVKPEWAGEKRDRIISLMKERYGIVCAISNPPTYQRWPYIAAKCGTPNLKVSEDIGRRLLCPPLHPLLTEEQELYICASLLETINAVKKEDR
jgi:perosamine synthetase